MDLTTLTPDLTQDRLIEDYFSFVWSERWRQAGDFELVIPRRAPIRRSLGLGTFLTHSDTKRTATIEYVEDSTDEEGREITTFKGRTIEAILLSRVARSALSDLTAAPNWTFTAKTPTNIVREIFTTICIDGAVSAGDKIPGISATINNVGGLAEPSDTIDYTIEPKNVLDAIIELAEAYEFGFQLTRYGYGLNLEFAINTGTDRTYGQSIHEPVIFSQGLENLLSVKQLTSDADYKNVAYVLAKNGSRIVYADGFDSSISGFNRKVLVVDANDIELAAGTPLQDALERRGKFELSAYRKLIALDGEISQSSKYQYGSAYFLGDLVNIIGENGITNVMRVTEQILSVEGDEVRSYPTLELSQLVTPGTWLSWDANQEWIDATGTWAEQ